MSEINTGPGFLKERFPKLAGSPEVVKAALRTEGRTDKAVPKDPEAQIQNYLDRFKGIVGREDPEEKENGIKALKKILTGQCVVRVEDIPESYWHAQMRVVRQRGESGDWQEVSEDEQLKIKQEHLAQTKEDQKGSLEEWIDYLASDKSSYLPDHLKYWAFQGMLRLERYEKGDKEKGVSGRFPERPTGRQRSVKMFPEANERALKFIAQAYDAQSKNQPINFRYDIPEPARQAFMEHLTKKDFRMIYGWGQEYIPPISEEEMKTTDGEWIIYQQGSRPKALTKSLQGKGSGWCIAGEQLAQTYLSQGNLLVYYSKDREGNFTIPRVVIVQKGNRVTEVRGIEWEENVDKYIKESSIIGDKLKEIPGGEGFFETDADTKRLTSVDRKATAGMQLDGEDLAFLYGIDRPIKYFGYKKDPRIAELRSKRHAEEDMPIIFGCERSQIAKSPDEINDQTKAYVGSLVHYDADGKIIPIFKKIGHLEHIYTSFPEGKIRRQTVEIGGKTLQQLEAELKQKSIRISEYAKGMFHSPDFTTLKNSEGLDTIRLNVRDLGISCLYEKPTTDQIYSRAKELGLELCPAEVGPNLRLKDTNQPIGECYYIAMKQIIDGSHGPFVFELWRSADGLLRLNHAWAFPGSSGRWYPEHKFVFSLRK